MFSIDTETGFDRVVLINAAWGLGENIVQGNYSHYEQHQDHIDKPRDQWSWCRQTNKG
jgi:pyruvate, water dikinase